MTGYVKTIMCLANSRKPSGGCVAGKEYSNDRVGEWIRPVSARPGREICELDRRYEDGSRARLLDIISIRMKEHRPRSHQQENHLIDDGAYWTRVGSADWRLVQTAVDTSVEKLWLNGHHSYHGVNDRMPEEAAATLESSLALIRPESLRVRVLAEGAAFQNHKKIVRAFFDLHGCRYGIRVTDPEVEAEFCARGEGTFPIDSAVLCVSLTEEAYQEHTYKLVAAIIRPALAGDDR